jgi:hypothetical protein
MMTMGYRWCVLMALQLISAVSSGALAIERWFSSTKPRTQHESTDEIWDEWLWHDEMWQKEIDQELSTRQ